MKLRFRYDRTVGFCRSCGLLEHTAMGCGGIPTIIPRFIDIVSMRMPFGFGGFAKVPAKASENPRFIPRAVSENIWQGGGVLASSRVPVVTSLVPNSFAVTLGAMNAAVTFTMPGVSAAEVAAQLALFWAAPTASPGFPSAECYSGELC